MGLDDDEGPAVSTGSDLPIRTRVDPSFIPYEDKVRRGSLRTAPL